MKMLQLDR